MSARPPSYARGVLARAPLEPMTGLLTLIDIVFLMLLFLVLTARFDPHEQDLPFRTVVSRGADLSRYLEPLRIRIESRPEGARIHARGRTLARPAELRAVVAGLSPSTPVLLDPDDGVSYDLVVRVYDACAASGLSRIRFARRAGAEE